MASRLRKRMRGNHRLYQPHLYRILTKDVGEVSRPRIIVGPLRTLAEQMVAQARGLRGNDKALSPNDGLV